MLIDFLEPLTTAMSQFGWRDALDIAILAVIIYALVKILSKTRAMRVVLGLGIILIFAWVAQLLDLAAIQWVFGWLLQASAVFIVILFQPELRRALEKLGRGRIFEFASLRRPNADGEELVDQFTNALEHMAANRVGAILVFERQTGLADIAEKGTIVDADVSAALIETIFYPNNPLHDGAMIIKNGRLWAAGCMLPLSDKLISAEYGSRHRASLGVSEESDAYVLVVSEERGEISYVYDGTITSGISEGRVRDILERLYVPAEPKSFLERVDLSADTKEIRADEIQEAQRAYEAEQAERAADNAQEAADNAQMQAEVAESEAEQAEHEADKVERRPRK